MLIVKRAFFVGISREKNRKYAFGIIRGPGEDESFKKPEVQSLVTLFL
jgi:hypothetical protein